MTVRDLLTPDPVSVGPDTPLSQVRALMVDKHIRHVLVVDEGKLVGVISAKDILHNGDAARTAMSHPVRTVEADTPVQVAGATMALHKVSCLPVVDDGELIGIVTTYDLLDAFARLVRDESER